jgi:hypothetical protein
MPIYIRICTKRHTHEVYRAFKDYRKPSPCPKCLLPTEIAPQVPQIVGGQISDATRKLLEVPFGRRNATGMKYTKDVDAYLAKTEKNWAHMAGGLGRNTSGNVRITPGHDD